METEQFIVTQFLSALPFEASEDQVVFFRLIAAFLMGNDTIFVLNGYAGTGKTTAMAAVTGALEAMGTQAVLLAPTGRSAKVMMEYAGSQAYTIHKAIYRQKLHPDLMKPVLEFLNYSIIKEIIHFL